MGYFDFLIDKDSLEAEENEYLYMHNMIWKANQFTDHIEVEKRKLIVINVTRQPNGSFHFNLKGDETDTLYRTNYPWAFASMTKENLLAIKQYEMASIQYENAKKIKENAYSKIKTLSKIKKLYEDEDN